MSSPNLNMRDPLLYRIMHEGITVRNKWCIYTCDDFAHPLSCSGKDTHSLCTLNLKITGPLRLLFIGQLIEGDKP
jgi:glutaminyl-tRNA synthetase